jgi:hypothetical protein
MPRPVEVARFLRAAVKAGMRLQRDEEKGTTGKTVADLQRIKLSMQKGRDRRSKQV